MLSDTEADLSFTDLVSTDMPLTAAFEPVDFRISFAGVFLTYSTVYPLSPKPETLWFEIPPHNDDHVLLRNSELELYGLKGSPVFPCHFNDAIQFAVVEYFFHRIQNRAADDLFSERKRSKKQVSSNQDFPGLLPTVKHLELFNKGVCSALVLSVV